MNNPDNDNLGIREAVVDHVIAIEMGPVLVPIGPAVVLVRGGGAGTRMSPLSRR